jgi:hypothetical protein
VWAINLLPELENLMRVESDGASDGAQAVSHDQAAEHCSSFFGLSVEAHGSAQQYLGHNEDWSEAARPHMYFLVETASARAHFTSCAGLVYPRMLPGISVTFNDKGAPVMF